MNNTTNAIVHHRTHRMLCRSGIIIRLFFFRQIGSYCVQEQTDKNLLYLSVLLSVSFASYSLATSSSAVVNERWYKKRYRNRSVESEVTLFRWRGRSENIMTSAGHNHASKSNTDTMTKSTWNPDLGTTAQFGKLLQSNLIYVQVCESLYLSIVVVLHKRSGTTNITSL